MEQFNLNWHTYNDHLKEMMQHLMQSDESTDVTLVCEDKTKFNAHKFILNACSPVFQLIIKDLPQKDPVIYLRGVLAPEMKSILQFMYLGQATLYQDRMNMFLSVAKSLEIKEIGNDEDCDVADSTQGAEYEKNIDPNIEDLYKETFIVNPLIADGEMDQFICPQNEAGQYPCNKCARIYTKRKLRYPCDNCSYKATSKYNLLNHVQGVHEEKKFPCELCGYKFSHVQNLNAHKKNKHQT